MPPTPKKIDVPEEHENESPEWKSNYQHAIDRGNSPKAAAIYATNVSHPDDSDK